MTSSVQNLFQRLFAAQWLNLNMVLQAVGLGTGLWGNALITQSNATGFLVWMVSNVALVWLQVRLRLWLLTGLFVAYLGLCFQGLAVWSQKNPESFPTWLPVTYIEPLAKLF